MGCSESRDFGDDESGDEEALLQTKARDFDIQAGEKEKAGLQSQLDELRMKLELAQGEAFTCKQQLEQEKEDAKKISEEKNQLAHDKADLLAQLEELKSALEKMKSQKAGGLFQSAVTTTSKDAVRDQRDKLQEELEKAHKSNEEVIKKFQAQLEELRAQRDAEKADLQKQIEELKERIKQLEAELSQLKKQLEREQQQSKLDKERMEQAMKALQQQLETAKAQMAALEKRMSDEQEAFRKQLADATQSELTFKKRASLLRHEAEDNEAETLKIIKLIQPIPTAVGGGDIGALKAALEQVMPFMDHSDPEKTKKVFGVFVDMVVPLYTEANGHFEKWTSIIKEMRFAIRSNLGGDGKLQRREAKRLFNAMRDAGVSGLNVDKSAPDVSTKLVVAFVDYFVRDGNVGNRIQQEIVRRVVACRQFLDFDLTDMSMCMLYTDKEDTKENVFFLDRAKDLIDTHEVPEFKRVLSSLETILYFLRYFDKEDLALTYKKYKSIQPDNWIMPYIQNAERAYPPGKELIKTSGKDLFSEADVKSLLEQLKTPIKGGSEMLEGLRKIFYDWAAIMQEKFKLLVLPHHTQVVCMLMLLDYIINGVEHEALIAEMGTGEGKSAVIACVALYCVAFLEKKVHVVVDDENLVERDFRTWQGLFNQFSTKGGHGVSAHLCVTRSRKEAKFKNDQAVKTSIDEEADIVYCEAKHVQSFYTSLAKMGGTDFKQVFKQRILILDEVDALVIDESPNVPFVYENREVSNFLTKVAAAIVRNQSGQINALAVSRDEQKHARSMQNAAAMVSKWKEKEDYIYDATARKYVRIQNGRINEGHWSLALEFKNYEERCNDGITYNERLFIMNRPRVFRLYSHIVGLSGSVGNDSERSFLKNVYHAKFFKVPVFLSTCKNAQHFPAESRGFYIQKDEHSQVDMATEKAFQACEKVPVLIIAGSRQAARELVVHFQTVADSKQLNGRDKIRSLSRDLYEANPEEFKENLLKSTQPFGTGAEKAFRITITDPRGGRGVDYRVNDADAENNGGLLVIVLKVPIQIRDWIQYLGRTARQDKHGQWMAIINQDAYIEKCDEYNCSLVPNSALETILSWGNMETGGKVEEMTGQYNRGLRMNELSEEVARLRLLERYPTSKKAMITLCNTFEQLSIAQIDEQAKQIKDLQVHKIHTEATEVGAENSTRRSINTSSANLFAGQPKSIIFLIDRSSSMNSSVMGSNKTRFQVCQASIMEIFRNNIEEHDLVGLYSFETSEREHFPLTMKASNERQLTDLINSMPQPYGLTKFYDSVLMCMKKLMESGCQSKFLIALTDGDDNMSKSQPNGEMVTAAVRAGLNGLNLIVITCGREINPRMIETLKYWIQTIQQAGSIGMYIPVDKPEYLAEAFEHVAELIEEGDGEVGE